MRRRAAGESLRELAPAYGVAHTTLGRYFARPEVVRVLRAEQRAAAARRAAVRRLEREVRRKARQQTAAERERRADLHSQSDLTAARSVAAGGGIEAVIEATGVRSRENVLNLIDPAILEQAFQNDAAAKTSRGARRRRPS